MEGRADRSVAGAIEQFEEVGPLVGEGGLHGTAEKGANIDTAFRLPGVGETVAIGGSLITGLARAGSYVIRRGF